MSKVILKAPNGTTVSVPVTDKQTWIDAGYKPLTVADVKVTTKGEKKS